MKKLVILSGAAVIGIIIAAAVVLHSQSGANDLFESNIRALSSENPDDVKIPCKYDKDATCRFSTVDADGVRRQGKIEKMIYTGSAG